jgi:hypothetical protein
LRAHHKPEYFTLRFLKNNNKAESKNKLNTNKPSPSKLKTYDSDTPYIGIND